MKQTIVTLLVFGGVVYLLVALWVYFSQRSLLYFPDTSRPSPFEAGFSDMQEVILETEDGLDLVSWYQPAEREKPTLLYFHGNAGNLLNHSWIARPFLDRGYGVLLLEYRGFGGNPGKPTEKGLYRDGRAAVKFLKGRGIAEEKMVFFGMSLGTGVAVKMATEFSPGALVLQSPYTSIAEVGQKHYWYLPVKFLAKDRFDAGSIISRVRAPVFVLYAEGDRIIPANISASLYERAPEPKTRQIIKNTSHNDLANNGGLDEIIKFLETIHF